MPTLEAHGVEFVHAAATAVDPVTKQVTIDDGQVLGYDYLVIATGYRNKTTSCPASPRTPHDHHAGRGRAHRAGLAAVPGRPGRRRRRRHPGRRLLRRGVRVPLQHLLPAAQGRAAQAKVKLTYVTAEPFLGPLRHRWAAARRALLGMFLKKEGIDARISVGIDHIDEGALVLGRRRGAAVRLRHGRPAVPRPGVPRRTGRTVATKGYVPVRDTYQTQSYDDVYAVGVAAAVDVPWQTPTPVGIPKTGFPTEAMAHIAAAQHRAQIKGEQPTHTRRSATSRPSA